MPERTRRRYLVMAFGTYSGERAEFVPRMAPTSNWQRVLKELPSTEPWTESTPVN
jgi:hypothetical protein